MPKIIAPTPVAEDPRTRCCSCGEPIHIDDLGGMGMTPERKEAWFHGNEKCLRKATSVLSANHANELRSELKARKAVAA